MPNLGFPELILIFVIALLVFGPKKLPELGKSLGKGLREFKKATDDIKSNFDEHLKDVEKSVDDVKSSVHDATKDIDRDIAASSYTPHQPSSTEEKAKEESKKEVHQT